MENQMTKAQIAKRKQLGATILEAIAFLGIAAIIIVGALAMFGSGLSGANTNQAMEQMTGLMSGTKSLFTGQGGYGPAGTNLNAPLIAAKAIPSTLAVSGSTITNSWGGNINVTSTGPAFTIGNANIPADVCIKMVSAAGGSQWVAISVNGSALSIPVTAAAATTACNTSANTVDLTAQ